jgi:hypothetical protein
MCSIPILLSRRFLNPADNIYKKEVAYVQGARHQSAEYDLLARGMVYYFAISSEGCAISKPSK